MKQGVLFYDQVIDRMDFEYDIESYYGGLHCGQSFEAFIDNEWVEVSIEFNFDNKKWYIPYYSDLELNGLLVRFK